MNCPRVTALQPSLTSWDGGAATDPALRRQMFTPRETILAALHARLVEAAATILRRDVLAERVPAEGKAVAFVRLEEHEHIAGSDEAKWREAKVAVFPLKGQQ